MLSSEDPSCSSKSSEAADLGLAGHGGEVPQPCGFSMRDYVFRSRRRDIRLNWPFPQQLLQRCLDNGVSDLLPPIETPTLVKARCLKRQLESEQLPVCAENKAASWNGESMDDLDLEPSLPLEESSLSKAQTESRLTKKLIGLSESETNVSSLTVRDPSEGTSGDHQLKKKCRLAGRPISAACDSASEGLVSNAIAASDPMASKVCPVCKSFTSPSNTTLNAHIDQCLSLDQSNGVRDLAELPKPKVKPLKKRLMVDIYATAKRCTLEDLNRRNGTNWAVCSQQPAPVAPAEEANLEPKRTRLVPCDAGGEGRVGDIYIDSNGTKLLILSNEPPPLPPPKIPKVKKKHVKLFTEGQSCSITKKKDLKSKHPKFMKNRSLSMTRESENEIEAAKRKQAAEAQEAREESRSQILNAHDEDRNDAPSALGHWVCSKRSDLSRKSDNKFANNKGPKKLVFTGNLSFRDAPPKSPDSSVDKNRALNLPSSSQATTSPKTKCMNMLTGNTRGLGNGGKLFRRSSSTISKSLESEDASADGHASSPIESRLPLLGASKSLTMKKSAYSRRLCMSLEEMELDRSERFISVKSISSLSCAKRRGRDGDSDVSEGSDGSSEDLEKSEAQQSDLSENEVERSLDTRDQQSNLSENEEERSLDTRHPQSTGESEHSVSREEAEAEVEQYSDETKRQSTSHQEPQCEDAVSNEVSSQDIQMPCNQSEPVLPQADITMDVAKCTENTQESSLTISMRDRSSDDHNTVNVDMESSSSAVSTVSTISLSSPVDDKQKESETTRVADHYPLLSDKLSSLVAPPPAREPSCSCSESLSRESQFSNYRKHGPASSVFIKPPVLPHPESHTESTMSANSLRSAVNISNPCSQPHSPSNPILRLMGKDLVVSKGETVQVPAMLPCDSYSSQAKFVSFGHNNVGFISYPNPYGYQFQPFQPQQPVWSLNRIASAPLPPRPNPVVPQYQAQEVIVIDDDSRRGVVERQPRVNFAALPQPVQNPNTVAPQTMFTCFAPQNPYHQYASRVFTTPGQRATPEGAFVFPPSSPLFFSPTMR